MNLPKKCPHHGWGTKKIFDSRTSKTAISVFKEPTLIKFQNNIISNPKEKRGVKTEILNRKIFLNIIYIICNYMFIYISTSSASH